MSKDNIMICLLDLDIGGVETVVVSQAKELIKRGYNVVILAKEGIYTDELNSIGVTCINFEFKINNKGYDLEKAKQMADLIYKYDIKQVHIHHFDCIMTAFPACIYTETKYLAYAHTGISGVYDWFENTFTGYDMIFKMYFSMAEKIVAITEEAKKENQDKYNINDDKYIVRYNSMNFNDLQNNQNIIPKKIEKFLIVGRLAEEKEKSIKNSINLFKSYLSQNENAKLTIVGDGKLKNFVEQEIESIKDKVQMLGARKDVIDIIKQHDVIIAVDRCILEAISCKRIAIISGYEGNKNIILPENIKQAASLNFSGREMENKENSEIINILKNLDEEKIKAIVNENFEYAYENLNIEKNLYVLNGNVQGIKYNLDKNVYFEMANKYIENINKEKDLKEKIYKEKQVCVDEMKITRLTLRNEIKSKEKQIDRLKQEVEQQKEEIEKKENTIDTIYKSKTWRYVENIRKIINKFKGAK